MKYGTGKVAFMVGIFGAIIAGLLVAFGVLAMTAWMTTLLVIAGLVIGFMNITDKEAVPVMVAALVIGVGAGVLAKLPAIGGALDSVLTALAVVVLPAGIVIAVKTIWDKAKN